MLLLLVLSVAVVIRPWWGFRVGTAVTHRKLIGDGQAVDNGRWVLRQSTCGVVNNLFTAQHSTAQHSTQPTCEGGEFRIL